MIWARVESWYISPGIVDIEFSVKKLLSGQHFRLYFVLKSLAIHSTINQYTQPRVAIFNHTLGYKAVNLWQYLNCGSSILGVGKEKLKLHEKFDPFFMRLQATIFWPSGLAISEKNIINARRGKLPLDFSGLLWVLQKQCSESENQSLNQWKVLRTLY